MLISTALSARVLDDVERWVMSTANPGPSIDAPRQLLVDQYLDRMRNRLPASAARHGWVVRYDHCFMRIILDRLFGDCWYNHLHRRTAAYRQLSDDQLRQCVAMADQILDPSGEDGGEHGGELLARWNRDSLDYRGK